MAQTVEISLQVSPELQRFLSEQWTPDDGRELMQIAENELAMHNFPEIWRYRQGQWEPLSRDYKRWKDKHYPGRKKWELTGAATQALFTPVKLGLSGGTAGAKSVALDTARKGRVVAEYEFKSPAAGGYFDRNNRLREIWALSVRYRDRIERAMRDHLASVMARAFGR